MAQREDDDGAVASSVPAASILLVDDDPEVRAVTSAYLTEMGHRVIEASDAASALDILRTDRQIDLLVADFAMPGMTGFDLAVRAQELRGGIGVLLVTGYADPDRMAKDFPLLHKPFGRAELSAKITEVDGCALARRKYNCGFVRRTLPLGKRLALTISAKWLRFPAGCSPAVAMT